MVLIGVAVHLVSSSKMVPACLRNLIILNFKRPDGKKKADNEEEAIVG